MSKLQALLTRCWISYRALFSWLNPAGYISSRLLKPIGLTVGFSAITNAYGQPIGYALTGASILSGITALIFGSSLAMGNEQNYATLDYWNAAPQSKLGDVLLRIVPHLVDGAISGLVTYLVAGALFQTYPLSPLSFFILLVLSLLSFVGVALLAAVLACRASDIFVFPNLIQLLLMVTSGALIPIIQLPGALQFVSKLWPLSYPMTSLHDGIVAGNLSMQSVLVSSYMDLIVSGFIWALAASVCAHLTLVHAHNRYHAKRRLIWQKAKNPITSRR